MDVASKGKIDSVQKPKQMRSAYMFYVKDHYRNTARSMPNARPQLVLQTVSEKWRNLKEKERDVYIQKENEDRLRYRCEKREWITHVYPNGEPKKKRKKVRRRDKDKYLPKRPRNSFIFFEKVEWSEVRKRTDDLRMSQPEMMRILMNRWLELTDDERRKYIDQAEDDKRRYAAEYNDYRLEKLKQKVRQIAVRKLNRALQDAKPISEEGSSGQPPGSEATSSNLLQQNSDKISVI